MLTAGLLLPYCKGHPINFDKHAVTPFETKRGTKKEKQLQEERESVQFVGENQHLQAIIKFAGVRSCVLLNYISSSFTKSLLLIS